MDITLEQAKEIVEEVKKRTAKECYKLSVSEEKASLTDTKLSGIPYMPEGDEFPQDEEGNDMALLAQINFEDIKLENYPEKGILQLFVGTDGAWPTPYKVRYYEDISRPARTDLKFTPMEDFVYEEVKLNLEKSVGYISVNDFRFNDIFLCLNLNQF